MNDWSQWGDSWTWRPETRFIVVHCSATKPSENIGAAQIHQMHVTRKPRPFRAIGYARVITRAGKLEVGRPLDAMQAHVSGHNSHSIGVCLIGGINEQTGKPEFNFTAAQMRTLRTTIEGLLALYPGATVCGHRDLSPDVDGDGVVEPGEWLKACPCFDVRAWWAGVDPSTTLEG